MTAMSPYARHAHYVREQMAEAQTKLQAAEYEVAKLTALIAWMKTEWSEYLESEVDLRAFGDSYCDEGPPKNGLNG